MATLDHYNINPRERPLSGDIIRSSQVVARIAADLERFSTQIETYPTSQTEGDDVAASPRDWVSGLSVSASGTALDRVTLLPGVLCQYSTDLSPAPDTNYDSPYRVAFNRANTELLLPAGPSGPFWHLLEVRASQVAAISESRDILNVSSGTAEATLVPKLYETQLEVQWTQGSASTLPQPNGGSWVPIAGVLFGNQQHAGPSGTCVIDLRPLRETLHMGANPYDKAGEVALSVLGNEATLGVTGTIHAHDIVGGTDGTVKMWIRSLSKGSLDLSAGASSVKEAGASYTAEEWHYLYLCPWASKYAPRLGGNSVYGPFGQVGRGIPVLSPTPPDADGLNTAAISLYDPWGGTAPIGTARCVGALIRNSVNTGWVPMELIGRRASYTEEDVDGWQGALAIGSGTGNDTLPRSKIPANAKRIKVRFEFAYVGPIGATTNASITLFQTSPAAGNSTNTAFFVAPEQAAGPYDRTVDMPDVPVPDVDMHVSYSGPGLDYFLAYIVGVEF